MKFLELFTHHRMLSPRRALALSMSIVALRQMGFKRCFSTHSEDAELKDFTDYIDSLKNYEKLGVPRGAGTDSEDGFDLGRMRRLMDRLGNPQSKFKAVHIAGTKGKGSTAAFLSSILRAEGYSVGCYSSPHLLTIRERMSLGRFGEPVSANTLNSLFVQIKEVLDEALKHENGYLSHFEVLTAIAFTLFAQENVDIAVIEAGLGGARDATNIISSSGLALAIITTIGEEHLAALGGSLEGIAMAKSGIIKYGRPLVLGGPFLPHIECILRDKALSMASAVVSASDAGNRSTVKGVVMLDGRPCQTCDLRIQVERDFKLFVELLDVKLRMLGNHQLQNAATATCAALSLRSQGWRISEPSIRSGLENTFLLGRSQFLTRRETEALGLQGVTVLLDGAHTKESANALVNMMRITFPEVPLALVVAMASDKDHDGFAREFLSGGPLEAVLLTETSIAGGKSRTTSASLLRDCWIQASKELGIGIVDNGLEESERVLKDKLACSVSKLENGTILAAESSLLVSLKAANQILRERTDNQSGIVVVTGSLHIVSHLLAALNS